MDVVIDIAAGFCLAAGGLFSICGAIGILRFPDFFSRTHGASVLDGLGAGLILLGLMIYSGLHLVTVKIALVFLFMMITGPTAVHALARAAHYDGVKPDIADPPAADPPTADPPTADPPTTDEKAGQPMSTLP